MLCCNAIQRWSYCAATDTDSKPCMPYHASRSHQIEHWYGEVFSTGTYRVGAGAVLVLVLVLVHHRYHAATSPFHFDLIKAARSGTFMLMFMFTRSVMSCHVVSCHAFESERLGGVWLLLSCLAISEAACFALRCPWDNGDTISVTMVVFALHMSAWPVASARCGVCSLPYLTYCVGVLERGQL